MLSLNISRRTEAIRRCWPNRKVLVAKPASTLSFTAGHLKTVRARRKKKELLAASHELHELSPEQLKQAQYLANIIPHHQRSSSEAPELDWEGTHSPFESSPSTTSTSSTDSVPSTPTKPRQPETFSWELRAAEVIAEKKLCLVDTWSAYTWRNKTSVNVRLKLLKDDGYDITPLQVKGVSSDQVTQAVLAHIGMRNQRRSADNVPTAQENLEMDDEAAPLRLFEKMQLSDENQLLDTPGFIPQKRRYSHDDEFDDGEQPQPRRRAAPVIRSLSLPSGPLSKKTRVLTPDEANKEIETDALGSFKKNICRWIFDRSRAGQANPFSTIIFAPPDPSSKSRIEAHVHLGTRGFAHIMDEIRSFSDFSDNDGAIFIRDPDTEEHQEDVAIPKNCIRISEDSQYRVLMQGKAYALVGLMERIRTQALIHTSQWVFDGMQVVQEHNISWSFGDATAGALGKIERLLQTGAAIGAVEVRVERIYNGKKMRYDCF